MVFNMKGKMAKQSINQRPVISILHSLRLQRNKSGNSSLLPGGEMVSKENIRGGHLLVEMIQASHRSEVEIPDSSRHHKLVLVVPEAIKQRDSREMDDCLAPGERAREERVQRIVGKDHPSKEQVEIRIRGEEILAEERGNPGFFQSELLLVARQQWHVDCGVQANDIHKSVVDVVNVAGNVEIERPDEHGGIVNNVSSFFSARKHRSVHYIVIKYSLTTCGNSHQQKSKPKNPGRESKRKHHPVAHKQREINFKNVHHRPRVLNGENFSSVEIKKYLDVLGIHGWKQRQIKWMCV